VRYLQDSGHLKTCDFWPRRKEEEEEEDEAVVVKWGVFWVTKKKTKGRNKKKKKTTTTMMMASKNCSRSMSRFRRWQRSYGEHYRGDCD